MGSYESWQQKEEEFHLEQAVLRSKIRISDGREKPIDFLAKVILTIEGKFQIPVDFLKNDYKKPFNLLLYLSSQDLKELLSDIETFQNIDTKNKRFQDYWKSMKYLVEIQQNKKLLQEKQNIVGQVLDTGYDDKICENEELEKEADEMIEGKSIEELQELEQEIEQSISSDKSFAMELQYWSNLLKKIRIAICQMKVQSIYDNYLSENNDIIQKQIQLEQHRIKQKQSSSDNIYKQPFTSLTIDNITEFSKGKSSSKQDLINEDEDYQNDDKRYNDGSLSPIPQSMEDIGYLNSIAISQEEDEQKQLYLKQHYLEKELKRLREEDSKQDEDEQFKRKTIQEKIRKTALNTSVRFNMDQKIDLHKTAMAIYEEMKRKGVGSDEQEFTDIVQTNIDIEKFDPNDFKKSRKPKFFNTVQTGYEWNKYNQTHYDVDNPPPKIVQGYKFNIFYPDLIDKTKTPQFYLEQSDTMDTLTIRFQAGPPYEDIAFKIVNKEWEMSERHGFKCVFDQGVMYLHFNFKKHRYRR